jgi:hypothetical protein
MKAIKKTKEFDCVKMKNDIQAEIYAKTKGMSVTELLAYFNVPSKQRPFGKQASNQVLLR